MILWLWALGPSEVIAYLMLAKSKSYDEAKALLGLATAWA